MPIVESEGQLVLRCVNYHGPQYMARAIVLRDPATGKPRPPDTTMAAIPGWTVVPAMIDGPGYGQIVDTEHSAPVQLYICRVCGYVEMYARPWTPPTGAPSGEPDFGGR